MKSLSLIYTLLFSLLMASAQAQVSEPTAIRIYRIGDQISTADAAGNITGFYPYADVSVKADKSLIKVSIKGAGSLYYTPALFWSEQGAPYGSTVSAALYLYQLSIPLTTSGGGSSTGVVTDASLISSGVFSEARLPASVVKTTSTITNPTFFTGLDPSRITQGPTARFASDAEKDAWNAKQGAITTTTDLNPRNITLNGTLTAPTPVTGTASNVVATTKFTLDEVMRILRDSLLAQYMPQFDPTQFVSVDTLGTSFIRIKPGLVTATAPATATSGTAVTGRVALTFTDAGVAAPIVAIDSSSTALRYYKGGSAVDWDSGPNSGVSTTRLPAGNEGYLEMRYFPMQDFAAIGFNASGVKTEQNLSRYQAGVYVNSSGKITTVVAGRASLEVASTFTAAPGSYIRLRRTTTGTFNVEYSADGASYSTILTDIRSSVPSVTPITSILYAGVAIHFNGRVYMPSSSNNFVTY